MKQERINFIFDGTGFIDNMVMLQGESLKSSASITKRLHDQLNDKDEEMESNREDFKEKEREEEVRKKK